MKKVRIKALSLCSHDPLKPQLPVSAGYIQRLFSFGVLALATGALREVPLLYY